MFCFNKGKFGHSKEGWSEYKQKLFFKQIVVKVQINLWILLVDDDNYYKWSFAQITYNQNIENETLDFQSIIIGVHSFDGPDFPVFN